MNQISFLKLKKKLKSFYDCQIQVWVESVFEFARMMRSYEERADLNVF